MPIILGIIIAIIVFIAIIAFMVAPGRADEKQKAPFINRYFAHRGLHNMDIGIPENSIPAFDAACNSGYGMELDVRLTSDGEIVVAHDGNLNRPCGVDVDIENATYEELQKYSLWGTEYKIPLFKDVLACVNGRTPIIVEIKPCTNGLELAKKTLDMLNDYDGEYCAESFDPRIVLWLKKEAPKVLRGQLANTFPEYDKGLSVIIRFFTSRCLFNFITKPQFIAYQCGPKPWPIKLTKAFGAMHVVWTSRPESEGGDPDRDVRENDTVIFEHYTPPTTIERTIN